MKRWLLLILLCALPVFAELLEYKVEVVRADNDAPIPKARVEATPKKGGTPTLVETDEKGVATLHLDPGEYYIEITHKDYGTDRSLVNVTQAAQTRLYLDPAGKEKVIRFKDSILTVETKNPNEGAVTRRDRQFLDRQVAETSVQGVLQTVPGMQRNSLGQTHVRGEHKSLAYEIDGVTIPIPLASTTSQPIDTDFLSGLSVRTGNLDGSQSGQTGAILEATTLGEGKPFFEVRPRVGNLGQREVLVRSGGRFEEEDFSYFVGAKTFQTDLQFEPPDPNRQTLNNRGVGQSYLVRLSGGGLSALVAHQQNEYQIPQTPGNFLAGVRQDQVDTNSLAQLSYKREVNQDTDLLMNIAYMRSVQSVNNNGVFTPFSIFDAGVSQDLADAGFPSDPQNAGQPYLPTTNLQITQVRPAAHIVHRMGERNVVKFGADADFITSHQRVFIADPGGGGALPGGTPVFSAEVDRRALLAGIFFTHTLPLSDEVTLNYGLRADMFDNGSNIKTGQLSPHVNLAWALGSNSVLRASFNRQFQAPPLEIDVSGQTFVLPQRVSLYELSYETELVPSLTGKIAAVRKDYRDQVDIGLLIPNTTIPLFAPVNFGSAYYQGLELSLNSHNKTGWNGFLAATLSEARPTAPGPFATVVPFYNDHDQRLQASFGVSHTWDNGFSAALDGLYASGFPQDALALYRSAGVFPYGLRGDRVDRFLMNLNFQYMPPEQPDRPTIGAGLQILNLFDDRPLLNFLSAFSGTRFVSQRRILVNAMIRF